MKKRPTKEQMTAIFAKQIAQIGQAHDRAMRALQRANWRTGGTASARREHERKERQEDIFTAKLGELHKAILVLLD